MGKQKLNEGILLQQHKSLASLLTYYQNLCTELTKITVQEI